MNFRSNPVPSNGLEAAPRAAYKGKYPDRIREVYGARNETIIVLNSGARYTIAPLSRAGRNVMPRLGDEVASFAACDYAITRI
jgi:hypothetical protein